MCVNINLDIVQYCPLDSNVTMYQCSDWKVIVGFIVRW